MSNNELNIGDILPPNKDTAEKFVTADSRVPDFVKQAAYEPQEVMEQTIQEDWNRLIVGLSDYVLAEQLTERELLGMGKPVAENYSEYFSETLKDVKKNRKKAEQKLFKMIPRHSQLEACDFFKEVEEQTEKEKEARERAMEEYPHAGVAKLDRGDNARKGLKKEAAGEPWTSADAQKGSQTNPEPDACSQCRQEVPARHGVKPDSKTYCQKCHDSGYSIPDNAAAPAKPAMKKEAEKDEVPMVVEISNVEVKDKGKISVKPNHPEVVKDMLETVEEKEESLQKEAASKWKAGQTLRAKNGSTDAHVAYVNEDDKIYVIKVDGTMYPSYYSYKDAHDTFSTVPVEETKDGTWAKSHGLS